MSKSVRSVPPFTFPYHSIRRISAPEDLENGREIHAGHAPAESFLELPTDENVREYLVDAEGKQRKRPTQVHLAMRETLKNSPHNFSILNGGIVIVARAAEIDDKLKVARLFRPSIINGCQTKGELGEYVSAPKKPDEERFPVHVKFELVVTDDDDIIGEISIARNFQNDVMTISIAGRRGQLDELERSFRADYKGARLRKSETQLSDDYVVTEKLLQVITALIPEELWIREGERGNPNKVYTYSMKAKCLKDFQHIWNVTHKKADLSEIKDPSARLQYEEKHKQLYKFYLDIAGTAWDLYEKWQSNPEFYGTRIRSIERERGVIKEVPDGIIFPILASLSAFAVRKNGKWTIAPPNSFSDDELIKAAVQVYQEIAHSNPWNMGKSKACYSALYQITSIYRRLSGLSSS